MPLSFAETRRYARQIALPEVGTEGQARLLGSTVALFGADTTVQTAGLYLAAAGVGQVRLVAPALDELVEPVLARDDGRLGAPNLVEPVLARDDGRLGAPTLPEEEWRRVAPALALEQAPTPLDPSGWEAVLAGVDVAFRSGFDDDPTLRACVKWGVPLVVARAGASAVDLLAFWKQGPCPHQDLSLPPRPATAPVDDGAVAVLAGTLAAAEVLTVLLSPLAAPVSFRARHLTLPLDGRAPLTQPIPWTPECFLCGGTGTEATLS